MTLRNNLMLVSKLTLCTIFSIHALLISGQESEISSSLKTAREITEEILIVTDRDDYIAGEMLWFSSWLIRSRSSQTGSGSTIARIEIINSGKEQVARSTFRLDGFRGYGQMKLSDTLGSGVYKIRAYTNLMRNLMPEMWFEKTITVYNAYKNRPSSFPGNPWEVASRPDSLPGISDLQVFTDDSFSTREEVNVEIQIHKVGSEPKLSVAIVPYGSLRPFNYTNQSHRKADTISGDLLYQAENDCYFISGKLVTKAGKPSPAGINVFFSVPGRVPVLKYARTDEKGRFSFRVGLDEKINEFIIQPDTGNIYQIILESSFSSDTLKFLQSSQTSPSQFPAYITEMSVNAQIATVYSRSFLGKKIDRVGPYRKQSRFYGKPAKEVFVKDFIQLSNMEEIFFEIIPGVSLIRTGGGYNMQLKNSMGRVLFDTPPLMMIDGVIIRDASIIARLDHTEVERIDVVQDQYMVGDCIFNGIVNVVTKNADFRNIPLSPGALRMQNNIFDEIYEFASPEHTLGPDMDHEPDYRNTLYWNPDLKPDADGKLRFRFRTSDVTGIYLICVQGLSSAGEPLSGYKLIQITK